MGLKIGEFGGETSTMLIFVLLIVWKNYSEFIVSTITKHLSKSTNAVAKVHTKQLVLQLQRLTIRVQLACIYLNAMASKVPLRLLQRRGNAEIMIVSRNSGWEQKGRNDFVLFHNIAIDFVLPIKFRWKTAFLSRCQSSSSFTRI